MSNINTFLQCYHKDEEQEGFYPDNIEKKFKPCYDKCKTCEGEGNDDNNNCLECKDDFDYDNGNCKLKGLICPLYYNYERIECINEIPLGYYIISHI